MGRFRRLRKNEIIRSLVRETVLTPQDIVRPFFVVEGRNKKEKINSMPGIFRYSDEILLTEIESYIKLGGKVGLFFGIPSNKDSKGSSAYSSTGVIQKAVKKIKKEFPEFLVITDVCLCAYTNHGHCGVLDKGYVDTDKTIPLLGRMAVSHAQAGADIVAPSDMMDFRVKSIRDSLDQNEFPDIPIMSYAVKYASAFYGPFRDAADCAPQSGNRKTYQMDPANSREAIKEALQDIKEGADFIMVKPALSYLDIISQLRSQVFVPIVAYSVSGEYSMIKAAAAKKWVDEKDLVLESLTSMKRAGADIIITYYAKDVLRWLKK